MSKAPIKVVVSGAAGNIGYAIVPRLLNGEVFGEDQPVALCMLEIPPVLPTLNGVVMELKDCAFACNAGLMATADPNEAMRDADVVVLVGGFPRKKGMLRKDLIQKNTGIFKSMGEALNYAKSTCKVRCALSSSLFLSIHIRLRCIFTRSSFQYIRCYGYGYNDFFHATTNINTPFYFYRY